MWLLLLVILTMLVYEETKAKRQTRGVAMLSPEEAIDVINHQQATVIDIRDGDAFAAGHIVNALNVPHADLDPATKPLKKYKDKPIVLSCARGQSCVEVAMRLHKAEFSQVYALAGGLEAWKTAQLPLVSDK